MIEIWKAIFILVLSALLALLWVVTAEAIEFVTEAEKARKEARDRHEDIDTEE